MTPERYQQVVALFQAASELEGAARAALLERACAGDEELRREVESLLSQDGRPSGGVLDRPALSAQMLLKGARLGPYEIEAPLGAGGMGEVFRAVDTRLGRKVAIKISAQQFSERFEREAHAISALNHPHVCTLYDVGPNYLVMELVEGETLAARLKKGPFSVEQAVQYGAQIADALAAAHAKGIIHRDLKPGNIMLTKNGVKVLDFGLAKAPQDETLTAANAVMGTPAYMAPEQREGRQSDARTDIYALGLILREMSPELPPPLPHVVERCIAQDPDDRWQAASDVRKELEWAAVATKSPAAGSPAPRAPWGWIAIASILLVAASMVIFLRLRETPLAGQTVRLQIPVPEGMTFGSGTFSISPDGRRIVFGERQRQLWVRELDSLEFKRLSGTELPPIAPPPFWSPDSRFIVFGAGGALKKVDLSGGPPQTICDAEQVMGGAWSKGGVIIFGSNNGGLTRCPAAGGAPTSVTVLAQGETAHRWPQFLPDNRHFLYHRTANMPEKTGVFVGSLDLKPAEQNLKPVLVTDRQAYYVPSPAGGRGWLLFVRETTLMAQPFDAAKLTLSGEPVPIASSLGSFPIARSFFSVSERGVLVYRGTAAVRLRLTWFDTQGKTSAIGEPGDYWNPAVSPDGTRVAVRQESSLGTRDLWVLETSRGTSTRLTFRGALNDSPAWSPDGTRIVFASSVRGGHYDLYVKASDGSGEEQMLLRTDEDKFPQSWSSDGRYLLYTAVTARTGKDLWVLPLDAGRKPFPFLQTDFDETDGQFAPSPGGAPRWIAYTSKESGSAEVYVRPFSADSGGGAAASAGKWMVSKGGGQYPHWRADGKQLFYTSPAGTVMAVDVVAEKTFQSSVPVRLFDSGFAGQYYGMTGDGKRFIFPLPQGGAGGAQAPFTVLLNWQAELKRQTRD